MLRLSMTVCHVIRAERWGVKCPVSWIDQRLAAEDSVTGTGRHLPVALEAPEVRFLALC